jgi:FdrA protein
MDPETAVILLDVEIGYGSHADPASVVVDEIAQAQEALKTAGRNVLFVASVCGTYEDFQGYDAQKKLLEQQGVIVLESNAQAADLAIQIVR